MTTFLINSRVGHAVCCDRYASRAISAVPVAIDPQLRPSIDFPRFLSKKIIPRVQRGDLVIAIGALLAAPFGARARQAAKIARIGFLATFPGHCARLLEAFLQGLHDLGYVEGRNLVIEFRYAEGKPERLPALAAELMALKSMSSWPQPDSPPWPPNKRPRPSPLSSLDPAIR